MNKKELIIVTRELKEGKSYPNADISIFDGFALPNYPKNNIISKETIVQMLRYQTMQFNGEINEQELSNCLYLLKAKKVIMV